MTEHHPHPGTTGAGRRRDRALLLGWAAGLTAALVVLVRVGRQHPGTPPLTRPGELEAWFDGRAPVDAAAGVVRVLAIALVGYLLTVTVLQVLLALRPTRRRPALLDRAGPRFLAVLTATLLTSTGPAGATDHGAAEPTTPAVRPGLGATMELVEPAPPGTARPETSLPWADPRTGPTAHRDESPPSPAAPPPKAETRGEWVVRPGDHLWGIAAEVVGRAEDAAPDERAIRDYWVRLIDANRDRLVDPENPDLILAGQRLRLP